MISRHRTAVVVSILLAVLFASPSPAQTPCQGSSGPDVIVGDITGPANYPATGGTLEAVSLGTTSCNLGTVGLGWHANTNQHPVIGGELYRFKIVNGAGRFEQVGLSWLKHGFFALSQNLCCNNCQATDGSTLGVGCSDPYTADRNGQQGGLGPRYQVNANTGFFTYPPPHPSGGNTGRIEVLTSDLEPSSAGGTRYFGNCQYVAPDDSAANNDNNNSSSREVTVTGSGSTWTFGFTGTTQREIPAIKAWMTCETGVNSKGVQILGEGLLILGWKVTPLGAGQYHYEYALYNMNSHDSVRSFSIPIASGVTVTNLGFHDVTYRGGDGVGGVNYDGTDWPSSNIGGTLAWSTSTFAQNSNANAIHWGTTYNFRFDANTAPMTGVATLGLFRSGGSVTSQAEIPSPGGPPDCNANGIPDNQDIQNGTSQDCDLNGVPDECQPDSDGDGTINACDGCPNDPAKTAPGQCGCGVADTDTDGDGTADCIDGCPSDSNKIAPGQCGCGFADTDSDGDGTADCIDGCPSDPNKVAPGQCGCGFADTDSDGDGTADCVDGCPSDPQKTAPGTCGCGVADTDSDGDGIANCLDNCPSLSNPGQEDCDGNSIGDACDIAAGTPDCNMNGVPDACDIAVATSQDANLDGIPDECQQPGGLSFCSGDGTGVPCPCQNSGGPGRGCANSEIASPGALLTATGNTVPDTVVLTSSGERPTALSIFLQGNVRLSSALHFGDGLRCAAGNLKRIAVENAVGGVTSYPGGGDPSISAQSAALGDPLSLGDIRIYQVYYRDPSGTFCPSPTGSTFNATQAVQLVW